MARIVADLWNKEQKCSYQIAIIFLLQKKRILR